MQHIDAQQSMQHSTYTVSTTDRIFLHVCSGTYFNSINLKYFESKIPDSYKIQQYGLQMMYREGSYDIVEELWRKIDCILDR